MVILYNKVKFLIALDSFKIMDTIENLSLTESHYASMYFSTMYAVYVYI